MSSKADPRYQLDLEAEQSLGGLSPELAWLMIKNLVTQAIEERYDDSEHLARKYDPPGDLSDLQENLEYMHPIRGCNLVVDSSPSYSLANVLRVDPLTTLEAVLRMVTINDRFQTGAP